MLEAYFVNGAGELVEEFFLECKSVYFRENENCWVCKSVLDDAGIIPSYRVPENYRLISVSIV